MVHILKITVSEEFTCGNASTNAVEFDASDLTQPISGQFTVSTFQTLLRHLAVQIRY